MSELKPQPFCVDAGKRIVKSLRVNLFFVSAWEQIDGGVGTEYFEKLFSEIIEDVWNRRARPDSTPRPIEEWGEDYGDCLWWEFPVEEPPYCGSPLASDWPGYHTHFTRIVCPAEPEGGDNDAQR